MGKFIKSMTIFVFFLCYAIIAPSANAANNVNRSSPSAGYSEGNPQYSTPFSGLMYLSKTSSYSLGISGILSILLGLDRFFINANLLLFFPAILTAIVMNWQLRGPRPRGYIWWYFTGLRSIFMNALSCILVLPDPNAHHLRYAFMTLFLLRFILSFPILFRSRTAWIGLTALSCNPILWVVNGFYVYNRWHFSSSSCDSAANIPHFAPKSPKAGLQTEFLSSLQKWRFVIRRLVWVGGVILCGALCIFPPYSEFSSKNKSSVFLGHYFYGSCPKGPSSGYHFTYVAIDMQRLALIMVAILALTGGCSLLLTPWRIMMCGASTRIVKKGDSEDSSCSPCCTTNETFPQDESRDNASLSRMDPSSEAHFHKRNPVENRIDPLR